LRALARPDARPWWLAFERDGVEQAAVLRATLADAYRTDRRAAVGLARRYSAGTAVEAVDGAARATADLLTDIAAAGSTSHARAIRSAELP
jgi:hypothetical protein